MERLRPYERNPQLHSPEQVAGIARSIEAYGMRDPIGVLPDGTIVEGHGRLEALRQMGRADVPVLVLHNMTDEEARAYRIAHNAHQKAALWDWGTLADEVAAMAAVDLDMGPLGLTDGELANLARTDEDAGAPWLGGALHEDGGRAGGKSNSRMWPSPDGDYSQKEEVNLAWGELLFRLPGDLYREVVASLPPGDARGGLERLLRAGLESLR